MNVSVAMTTFNGEKYIKEQLDSIISQISSGDEIIICDDGSTDNTYQIIADYQKKFDGIKIYRNNRLGFVKNFEFVIKECSNELIFLSDQDDIWLHNKVERIKREFLENAEISLVLHNAYRYFEEREMEERLLIENKRNGWLVNIITNKYWGCCIAFKREILQYSMPFPPKLVTHDKWLGIIAESRNEAKFLDEALIKHRFHDNNVAKKLPLLQKISTRLSLLKDFVKWKHMKGKL